MRHNSNACLHSPTKDSISFNQLRGLTWVKDYPPALQREGYSYASAKTPLTLLGDMITTVKPTDTAVKKPTGQLRSTNLKGHLTHKWFSFLWHHCTFSALFMIPIKVSHGHWPDTDTQIKCPL